MEKKNGLRTCIQLAGASFFASAFLSSTRYSTCAQLSIPIVIPYVTAEYEKVYEVVPDRERAFGPRTNTEKGRKHGVTLES